MERKTDLEKQMILAERHDNATALTEKFRLAQEIEQQQQKAKNEREVKAKQQAAPYHGSQQDPRKRPRRGESSNESGEASSSSGSGSGSSGSSSSDSEEASYPSASRKRVKKADEKNIKDRQSHQQDADVLKYDSDSDSSDDHSNVDPKYRHGARVGDLRS